MSASAESLKKKRTLRRRTFNVRVNAMNSLIQSGETCYSTIDDLSCLATEAYEQLKSVSEAYVLAETDEKELEKGLSYIEEIEDIYLKLKIETKGLESKVKPKPPIKEASTTKATVKCKQIEFKPFSNDMRDYPAWKQKFQKHFQSHYGDEAGIVLKDALQGEAAMLVRTLDSVDDIFNALDKKYGNQQKLVECIISSIEAIPICHENDLDSLRNLLDTVKLARKDLEFMNLSREIEHSSTVKLIERRLPLTLKQKWAEHKLDHELVLITKLFPALMDFLEQQVNCAEDVATMGGGPSVYSFNNSVSGMAAQPAAPRRSSSAVYSPPQPTFMNGEYNSAKSTTPSQASKSGDTKGKRFCTVHNSEGHHWPRWCKLFQRKTVNEQIEWLQTIGKECCRLCLAKGHGTDGSKCPLKFRSCGVNGCEKKHASYLHETLDVLRQKEKPQTTNSYAVSTVQPGQYLNTISPAQKAFIVCQVSFPIGVLIDTGSVVTLIHNRVVRQANLKRADDQIYHVTMETVGGDIRKFDASAYEVPLRGSHSSRQTTITALGVDSIGSSFPTVDIDEAKNELGIQDDSFEYPSNFSLDLLVGMDNAHISLSPIRTSNGLVLAQNVLGKTIYGTHNSFRQVLNPRHYRATCYSNITIADLYSTDVMGVECSPRCGSCRCGQCSAGSGNLSIKEEREYQLIRDGMKLEGTRIIARFPWIKSPNDLPNNYDLAYKRLLQTERRLRRDPNTAQKYQEQIQDMLDRQVARKLSVEEDVAWKSDPSNPIQYLPHHEVLKPSSKSTPVRIVFDPSSPYMGHAINNFWGTGPNLIVNSLGLLIRFRENRTALVSDIAKMYQTVHTTPMEWHCHRFLWRNLDETRDPDTYIIVKNSFGSRPSGAVAIAALHLVAEAGEAQFPLGARTIREQTYVDDIMDSADDPESAREIARQTEECLALGEFKVKGWITVDTREHSRDCTDETIRQIPGGQETVLGVCWDLATDSFFLKAKLNFSPRKKNVRQEPDLLVEQIFDRQLIPVLTLRNILSQVNGYFDPIGLLGPYLVELKFALAKLWKVMKPSGLRKDEIWDQPIPIDHDELWRKLLNVAFAMEELKFSRHLKPADTVGEPWLVMFSDSSMMSFGTVAYIRWKLPNDEFWSRLIASKSRIWPIDENDFLSMCRGELQGAVLSKRLAQTIISQSRFRFDRVLYIVDSEIVRAQIAKDSHAFDIFVGNRVGEIRTKTSPDQWYHTPGPENVSADLLSRGTTNPDDLNSESFWQNGPPMLSKPFSEWPVSQRYTSEKPLPELRDQSINQRTMVAQTAPSVPPTDSYGDCAWNDITNSYELSTRQTATREVVVSFDDLMEQKIAERIDVSRFSKLKTLLGTTYRVLHVLSWQRGDGHFIRYMRELKFVNANQLESALSFWIRAAQRELLPAIKSGKLIQLKPALDDTSGVWRLNGRFGENVNGYHPIVLPSAHPFVDLLVTEFHNRGHCGATTTAAKVRNGYHVFHLKKIAKRIRNNCTFCRRLEKRLLKTPMAPLPIERFRPSFAFEHCACDIFGPFLLQVPGRVTRGNPMTSYGKGYGLLFNCLTTRALHIEAMEGQDTSAFLFAFRRFSSIRGQPRFMWSDNGQQIVAADNELKHVVAGWDDQRLKQFGAYNGIRWQYIAPGSPWQNGVSEALVKSVKRSMAVLWQSKPRVPIMELQTIFYEITGLLNERPINLGHEEIPGDWDSEVNTYLCPNQLLLGRATVRIPPGPFKETSEPHTEQFLNLQRTVDEWWKLWTDYYLPTLLIQSKWHTEDRAVQIGDIVHVRDTNLVRGNWQIAEVIATYPSADDKVRRVVVRYKRLPDTTLDMYSGVPDKTEERDVKNLVILVTKEERKMIEK